MIVVMKRDDESFRKQLEMRGQKNRYFFLSNKVFAELHRCSFPQTCTFPSLSSPLLHTCYPRIGPGISAGR